MDRRPQQARWRAVNDAEERSTSASTDYVWTAFVVERNLVTQ